MKGVKNEVHVWVCCVRGWCGVATSGVKLSECVGGVNGLILIVVTVCVCTLL